MRYVLAWDLGTSGAKVGIVNLDGEVLGTEIEPTELILLPDGGAEQRPDDWWRALSLATERLLARELVPRASIAAIGVTAQWAGTVAIDATGAALHNALIWMDSRGAAHSRRHASGLFSVAGYSPWKLARWVRLTGGAPARSGKDPFAHILWIKHEHPELYARTHKLLEPKDYLTFRLSGRLAASFESIALHWVTDNRDPDRVRYDPGLLDLAGLEREKLPDLCRAVDVLGPLLPEHRKRFGLSADTVVACGAPDVHAAAIGSGATRDFDAHLYVGTSSWIACHVPGKRTSLTHNMAALPAALPGRYLVLNDQETAGACLVHLRDNLFFPKDELGEAAPPDVFPAFDRIAASSPPGSRGLIFLPWLYGERTPVEDHKLRGGWVNYSLMHERRDVLRAVLEGVAMNARWLLSHVSAFLGRSLPELRFIGGGANSELWTQIFADVLGCPIQVVRQPLEANLRGAALIAFAALGEIGFDAVPERVPVVRQALPRAENEAVYDRAFGEFLALHRATRPIFHRLNS
jgi:xylulokinase